MAAPDASRAVLPRFMGFASFKIPFIITSTMFPPSCKSDPDVAFQSGGLRQTQMRIILNCKCILCTTIAGGKQNHKADMEMRGA